MIDAMQVHSRESPPTRSPVKETIDFIIVAKGLDKRVEASH